MAKVRFMVQIGERQLDVMCTLADRRGVSTGELVRRACDMLIDKYGGQAHHVISDDIADELIEKYHQG